MAEKLEVPEGLIRIRVPLDRAPGERGPEDDLVWGEPLGGDRYRLESCPFFAYGLSRDDVIRAGERDADGAPLLEHVVEKGGHRTLRVALDADATLDSPAVQELLDGLVALGCTHETLRPKIVAIDLPPQVDVAAVVLHLEALARTGLLLWEWADPRPC
jgi:hypothetical protein